MSETVHRQPYSNRRHAQRPPFESIFRILPEKWQLLIQTPDLKIPCVIRTPTRKYAILCEVESDSRISFWTLFWRHDSSQWIILNVLCDESFHTSFTYVSIVHSHGLRTSHLVFLVTPATTTSKRCSVINFPVHKFLRHFSGTTKWISQHLHLGTQ